MNDLKLHHIGIAVKEIAPVAALLDKILGLEFGKAEEVKEQGVRVAFSRQMPAVELIEAASDRSPYFPLLPNPIKSHIVKMGEGLHHICFSVSNIDQALEYFAKLRIRTVGKGVYSGFRGSRVFFLDPKDAAGILIEIKEHHE